MVIVDPELAAHLHHRPTLHHTTSNERSIDIAERFDFMTQWLPSGTALLFLGETGFGIRSFIEELLAVVEVVRSVPSFARAGVEHRAASDGQNETMMRKARRTKPENRCVQRRYR